MKIIPSLNFNTTYKHLSTKSPHVKKCQSLLAEADFIYKRHYIIIILLKKKKLKKKKLTGKTENQVRDKAINLIVKKNRTRASGLKSTLKITAVKLGHI